MRRFVALLAVVALATPVLAADLAPAEMVIDFAGHGNLGGSGTFGTTVYSNMANPLAGWASHAPGTEAGDELQMISGGLWEDIGFSVYNSSAAVATLVSADITVRMYNDDGAGGFVYAGGVQFNGVSLGLGAGWYTTLSASDMGTGVSLTPLVLATTELNNVVWSDGLSYNTGQIISDPPTIGSSADYFFNNGSWYWFGGSPVANLMFEVGVPEPATLMLLGVGLTLFRRR